MRDRAALDWKHLIRRRAAACNRTLSEDVVAELAEHIADVYTARLRDGASEEEARQAALATIERSALDEIAERPRAARAPSRLWTDGLHRNAAGISVDVGFDVRHAWRSIRRQPAFSAAVAAILAVGIGATTAAYGVIDAVLLRPLPYPDPKSLVVVKHITPRGETDAHAAADWQDYADRGAAVVQLAAFASWPMNITGNGAAERLRSVIVSGNFFDVLGGRAAIGRAVNAADDSATADAVAVLSHGFWSRRFGGDRGVIGRSIVLNGRAVTIVGVMTRDFQFPDRAVDLWMPMAVPPAVLADRVSEWVSVVGRVRPGVDIRAAEAELQLTSAALARAYPKTNADERVAFRTLQDEMVRTVRKPLWLGGLAALFVLLAGAANAGNLMIARATLRQDEVAIRSALGAEPARIARQLIAESLLLAACGGAPGVAAAFAFERAFAALAEGRVPRIEDLHLTPSAFAVAALAAAASALVFGGAAVWILLRRATHDAHSASMRVTTSNRIGSTMLASQVAFALVLTAGAAVVARSYAATARLDPGFDTSSTLTMQTTLPRSRYPDSRAHAAFAARVVADLSAVPGVVVAGVVSDLPLVGNAMHFAVRADGSRDAEQMTVRPADEGFFRTLRIPASAGRLFDGSDRAGAPAVAILNASAARRFGAGVRLGSRITVSGESPRTVVGIVNDIRHSGLRADEGPVVYVPYAQKTFDFANWIGVVVRGSPSEPSAASVRAVLAKIDPDQPLFAVRPMIEYVNDETAPYRFGALVVFSLAAVALLLAVTGIYGMTAFVVGTRTKELGIRLALGASPSTVIRLVLGQVAAVLMTGTVVGGLGALATNALVQRSLEDTPASGTSAAAVASAALVVAITAVGAATLPALRASRIDPRSALQAE